VADGTDYKDGTAIQLLVEQTEQPTAIDGADWIDRTAYTDGTAM